MPFSRGGILMFPNNLHDRCPSQVIDNQVLYLLTGNLSWDGVQSYIPHEGDMDGETGGKYHQASPNSLTCTKVQVLFNDCFIVKNQDS